MENRTRVLGLSTFVALGSRIVESQTRGGGFSTFCRGNGALTRFDDLRARDACGTVPACATPYLKYSGTMADPIPRGPMVRYVPAGDRYEQLEYRRCGRSGLQLPPISLGLWQNFGDDRPLYISRAILRRAFDLGITHFDLANNYGPPYGSAEINFGRMFAEDFAGLRDEIVISTKAGYDMWPGPYGEWGSRKYLLSSLDQSLTRMRLDHVDIFYSHRFDPDTPLQRDDGCARRRCPPGKGAVRRDLVLQSRSGPPRRSRSCASWARRC